MVNNGNSNCCNCCNCSSRRNGNGNDATRIAPNPTALNACSLCTRTKMYEMAQTHTLRFSPKYFIPLDYKACRLHVSREYILICSIFFFTSDISPSQFMQMHIERSGVCPPVCCFSFSNAFCSAMHATNVHQQ